MSNADLILDVIGDVDVDLIPELTLGDGQQRNADRISEKKKRWFIALSIGVTVAAVVVFILIWIPGGKKAAKYDSFALSKELPVAYNEACFVIDVNNPETLIGFADYVFVARVDEELRTEYDKVRRNEKGNVTGIPYTFYNITVVNNIKGNLKKNEQIELKKHGGVNYDKTSISLFEGDKMLESGKYYIIIANAQEDGSLMQMEVNSGVELDISGEAELSQCTLYNMYREYYINEKTYDRQRFQSIYENIE